MRTCARNLGLYILVPIETLKEALFCPVDACPVRSTTLAAADIAMRLTWERWSGPDAGISRWAALSEAHDAPAHDSPALRQSTGRSNFVTSRNGGQIAGLLIRTG